jgi:hypothetical protein
MLEIGLLPLACIALQTFQVFLHVSEFVWANA